MKYPIIDNLIYAYQRNGWTGLELTEGKNLIKFDSSNRTVTTYGLTVSYDDLNQNIKVDGVYTGTTARAVLSSNNPVYPLFTPGDVYTLSFSGIRESSVYFQINYNRQDSSTAPLVSIPINYSNITFSVPSDYGEFRQMFIGVYGNAQQINTDFVVQLEKGSQVTPYEPYAPPTTDIKDRLKLPMIHYFPHPVIDALQRAAAGTQTADDTEILRHYLTPLGIGGI